ncbi:MAG TPA: HAD family hydrolase [Spirochaetota bacterium]|nr:HAD family hydrolase [Spirochaetota bacterium]HRS76635.1 HAD family hydrolase [Spirochaetota bacterium]HRT74088.1 HAD family hydrolase [Spirochaetota bacterium]
MDPLRNKQLIIFDCDGVLIDSHDANLNFFNSCLVQGGHPPLRKEDREKVVFMSTRQLMFELFPDPAEADRLFRISQETDYTPFLKDVHPLFDFTRVFDSLRSRFHLAMATNRGRSLDRLFKYFNLDAWFEFRISTVDAEPKPHPEMLIKCIEFFGIQKTEAIYLGDTASDQAAAANAGMDYLWVGGDNAPGIQSVEDLLQFL